MKTQHEIDIYGLAYGGNGVGRLDGKVCFIEGALPGEKIRFIKRSEEKKFITGRAVEILKASELETLLALISLTIPVVSNDEDSVSTFQFDISNDFAPA